MVPGQGMERLAKIEPQHALDGADL